jgi:hypothetical protein
MANTSDSRSQNQPSKEAQIKGGQHSHQGTADKNVSGSVNESSGSSDRMNNERNQPSKEAQIKGGQHSHSGGKT